MRESKLVFGLSIMMMDPFIGSLNIKMEKKIDGPFQMFHKNGALKSEVVYKNDKPSTNWIYYDKDGRKEKEDVYKNGKFIYEKYFE